MPTAPRPLSVDAVAELVAERASSLRLAHPVRVAVDGPAWSGLQLVEPLVAALATWSRPVLVVRAADYLRPASLRLEHGRDDPDAFYGEWLDRSAMRREVLQPAGPDGSRQVLPTLWDAEHDRATRADYVEVPTHGVVIVAGWLMLRGDLPFDLTVHIALSSAARARRCPSADAERELPAYDRYEEEARPREHADIVVRADDPRHPAVEMH